MPRPLLKSVQLPIVLFITSCFITGCSSSNSDSPYTANAVEQDILNKNNAYDVIKGVIELLNEEPMTSAIAVQRKALRNEELIARTALNNPYEFISPETWGTWSSVDEYEWSCAGGGSTYVYTNWEQQGTEDRVFNNCLFDSYTINGTSGERGAGINASPGNFPYSEFTVTNASGDNVHFTGNYRGGSTSRVSVNEIRQWENLNLTKVSEQEYLEVNEYNLRKFARKEFDGSAGAGLTASLTVSAPWSHNNPVSVTASLSYLRRQDTVFEWQSGSIEILAADGGLIIVKPAESASNSWVASIDEQQIDVIPATGEFWVSCGSSEVCPAQ